MFAVRLGLSFKYKDEFHASGPFCGSMDWLLAYQLGRPGFNPRPVRDIFGELNGSGTGYSPSTWVFLC